MLVKRLIALLLPLAFLTGCANMEGKWSLAKVDPTAARSDFAFEALTLQEDGTFYGEARQMGRTDTVSGTWSLDDKVLTLNEESGERHTYDARLANGGNELKLVRHWEGRRLTAVFEKTKEY